MFNEPIVPILAIAAVVVTVVVFLLKARGGEGTGHKGISSPDGKEIGSP